MCFKTCCFGRAKDSTDYDSSPLLPQSSIKKGIIISVNDDCSLVFRYGRCNKITTIYFAGIRYPQIESFDPIEARLAIYVTNMLSSMVKGKRVEVHEIDKKSDKIIEATIYYNNKSVNDWMLYHNFAIPEYDIKTTWEELSERSSLFAIV